LWLVGCCTAAIAATNGRLLLLLLVALDGVACFVKRETRDATTPTQQYANGEYESQKPRLKTSQDLRESVCKGVSP
jgi:hypothetical protein